MLKPTNRKPGRPKGQPKSGGRKPDDPEAGAKVTGSYRVAPDVAAIIKDQLNQSAYLEAAVRHYHATT